MEYVNTLFINDIIHNFKQVAIVVEAQKQMFIQRIIPNIIIYYISDGVSNSFFLSGFEIYLYLFSSSSPSAPPRFGVRSFGY